MNNQHKLTRIFDLLLLLSLGAMLWIGLSRIEIIDAPTPRAPVSQWESGESEAVEP